jgi:hypothetical protein
MDNTTILPYALPEPPGLPRVKITAGPQGPEVISNAWLVGVVARPCVAGRETEEVDDNTSACGKFYKASRFVHSFEV